FYHGHMVRHPGMTKFLEPLTGIFFHACETVRGHKMALRFDGLSFACRHKIFPLQTPKAEYRNRHFRPKSRFDYRGLFDIEMPRDSRSPWTSNRLAKRQRRGASVPKRDGFGIMLQPIG